MMLRRPSRRLPWPLALLPLLGAALPSHGQTPASPPADHAQMEATRIIGNRELPKVLYIVPWKNPAAPDLRLSPPLGGVDEALAPLDRDVFRRRIQYTLATTAAPPPAAQGASAPRP